MIDRNVQALCGRAAIEALQSIKLALHIVDPNFEVDAIYHAARPGLMRIEITAGGKVVYAEAFNGTDLKTGKVLEKVTVREITLNPPAPEGFFDTFEH